MLQKIPKCYQWAVLCNKPNVRAENLLDKNWGHAGKTLFRWITLFLKVRNSCFLSSLKVYVFKKTFRAFEYKMAYWLIWKFKGTERAIKIFLKTRGYDSMASWAFKILCFVVDFFVIFVRLHYTSYRNQRWRRLYFWLGYRKSCFCDGFERWDDSMGLLSAYTWINDLRSGFSLKNGPCIMMCQSRQLSDLLIY